VVYQARAALLCDQPYPLIRVGQSSGLANSTTTSSTDPGVTRQAEWTMSELPGAAPATDHDEGSPRVVISGLNHTTFDLAVYASQGWSPTHHARLASGCWSGSTGRDWLPAGFHLKGFKFSTILVG
jgi:hypothetical protein